MSGQFTIPADAPYTGKPCTEPGCDGKLYIETTIVIDDGWRLRSFKCDKCGRMPANHVLWVPLVFAPPQAPRKKKK